MTSEDAPEFLDLSVRDAAMLGVEPPLTRGEAAAVVRRMIDTNAVNMADIYYHPPDHGGSLTACQRRLSQANYQNALVGRLAEFAGIKMGDMGDQAEAFLQGHAGDSEM